MFRSWNRTELSWAFYDWANSVFPLLVVTAFFPFFLAHHQEMAGSSPNTVSIIGNFHSAASIVVVLLAPVLGALGDQYGGRRKLLAAFAVLGILATFSLSLVESGRPLLATFVLSCGTVGFALSNGLYDSLLVSVTSRDRLDRLSAFGFSLGYAGSLMLFLLGLGMTLKPDWFGFADAVEAMRVIFVLAALWWAIFMIPLMIAAIDEKPLQDSRNNAIEHVASAFRELGDTFRELRQYRNIAIFLLAYWLYIDGVLTVYVLAVPYANDLGFPGWVPQVGVLIVQVIAIPATLAYGRLAKRYGRKRLIMIGVLAYVVATSLAPFMSDPWHFLALAVLIGLAQGGIQSMSRAMFARFIPASESGKYFGFYNMIGKFASIIGPFLTANLGYLVGSRYSILALPPILVIGLIFLSMVDDSDDDSGGERD